MFSLTEGASSFQINYVLTSGSVGSYSFKIIGTAKGGATFSQLITLVVQCG